MLGAAIVGIGLGLVGSGEFLRPFGAKAFDQATLEAEGFGDKKAQAREDDGLRIAIAPGEAEAGWKTPAGLRIGGDCSIIATLVLRKLPKPGQEDGVAIGLAVATQNLDQPDVTLLRVVEPDGKEVFRPVQRAGGGPPGMMMNQPMMMFNPFGGGPAPNKPAKPTRTTFPAKGPTIRLEFRRKGPTIRYQVSDDVAPLPREIGQFQIGPGDLMGVKLFASNRNGAEGVDVLFRDLTIQADRLSGLGTAVRTIAGTVLHGDPTGIEAGSLAVGGPPPAPAPGTAPAPAPGPNPVAPTPGVPVIAPPMALVAPAPAAVAIAPPQIIVADDPDDEEMVAAPPNLPGMPMPAPPPGQAPGPPRPPKPKVLVPLDEVESITFERAGVASARYLGQPNVDTTGPGGPPPKDAAKEKNKEKEAKKAATPGDDLAAPPPGTVAPVAVPKVEARPNGVRDLHLTLSGLRPAAVNQVTVQCPTDKGQGSWRLDTSGSQDSPLTLRRAGLESFADLFLEPPAGDCNDKMFMINLVYADGQNANIQAKATGHTDPKLAFDPEAPAPPLDARVYLVGDEQLFGKLEAITEEALTLTTSWGDRLDVPLARVVGVFMGMPDHRESPESFAKRLKTRGNEDLLLARAKDGEVVAIAGVVEGAKANKLAFAYQGKARSLPLKQVEGLVLANRPPPKPPGEVRATFALSGGQVVSGRWDAIEAATWRVETPWGQPIKLPAADVRHVRFRGGGMTYLSDLEPTRVDEAPYFGRKSPYRKDVALDGGPLRLDGRVVDKGLAVHSRSSLTYDLDRRYSTFEATVGFDDSGKKKGRVDCRVIADGKELYANPDLRADGPIVRLNLPVAGAEQLTLLVDFGPDEDTGDRVIWADARLYRRPPGAAPTPPASGPR